LLCGPEVHQVQLTHLYFVREVFADDFVVDND
jgi:hypothetical protein